MIDTDFYRLSVYRLTTSGCGYCFSFVEYIVEKKGIKLITLPTNNIRSNQLLQYKEGKPRKAPFLHVRKTCIIGIKLIKLFQGFNLTREITIAFTDRSIPK